MHHHAKPLLRRTDRSEKLAHPFKAGLYAEPMQWKKKSRVSW